MKARKKNSNDEWKEVEYIQLKGSNILFKQEEVELIDDETAELDAELELYKQWGYENPLQDYWQDVRERAAIAAMQGILANASLIDAGYNYRLCVAKDAVVYADALVKQLKEHNNETH